ILGSYLGFIVATLLTGVMADLLGNRGVLLLAAVCLCLGSMGLMLSDAYPAWVLFMGVLGLGLGAIEVGGNGLMVDLHAAACARYLNLLATFHGVGSLLVPLVAAWLLSSELSWQRIYLSALLVALALIALLAAAGGGARVAAGEQTKWNWAAVLRLGFTLRMCWHYLLIGAYVAVELGLAAWLVEYLQQVRGVSLASSSWMLSGFFMMIMLGRLLGSFLVDRIPCLRLIGGALLGGGACLLGGILGPEPLVFLLPLAGLFFSIVFPTVTAVVSTLHQAHLGSILGLLFTFAGVGGALGPWTVGLVSDRWGLQIGLSSILGYCLLALLALVVVSHMERAAARQAP
ncbi:MAG: MFS transporter, partial [Planctomycetales bacterium]|nr:MFS transporter [Planctomycetales bacterium]